MDVVVVVAPAGAPTRTNGNRRYASLRRGAYGHSRPAGGGSARALRSSRAATSTEEAFGFAPITGDRRRPPACGGAATTGSGAGAATTATARSRRRSHDGGAGGGARGRRLGRGRLRDLDPLGYGGRRRGPRRRGHGRRRCGHPGQRRNRERGRRLEEPRHLRIVHVLAAGRRGPRARSHRRSPSARQRPGRTADGGVLPAHPPCRRRAAVSVAPVSGPVTHVGRPRRYYGRDQSRNARLTRAIQEGNPAVQAASRAPTPNSTIPRPQQRLRRQGREIDRDLRNQCARPGPAPRPPAPSPPRPVTPGPPHFRSAVPSPAPPTRPRNAGPRVPAPQRWERPRSCAPAPTPSVASHPSRGTAPPRRTDTDRRSRCPAPPPLPTAAGRCWRRGRCRPDGPPPRRHESTAPAHNPTVTPTISSRATSSNHHTGPQPAAAGAVAARSTAGSRTGRHNTASSTPSPSRTWEDTRGPPSTGTSHVTGSVRAAPSATASTVRSQGSAITPSPQRMCGKASSSAWENRTSCVANAGPIASSVRATTTSLGTNDSV